MSSSAQKPNAIIFGGVNSLSRTLAAYLVPLNGDRLVGHLRIVDKFSVNPPTTYLGAEFPKVLAQPNVEYKQVNLTVATAVSSAFDPPEGVAPYSLVFDFTGEFHLWTETIIIGTTFNVSRLLGLEAAKRKVKAFIRTSAPFYETPDKGSHTEKEDIKPSGVLGIWWHETLRALAAIEDLNLVIVRTGFVYGPYVTVSLLSTVITVAAVYGYMKKPMKTLWSPGKDPMHTVHIDDVAGAMWACAQWMAPLGRKEADTLAGEEIIFHNDKSKIKTTEGVPPHNKKLIAPVFNLVDDSELTLAKAGEIVTSFFGTTFEFYDMTTNILAKFKFDDLVEEINDHHVSGWTEMITTSNPPIPNTPLSAYMNNWQLSRHKLAYSNVKIKEIVQYKLLKPHFNHANIKEVIDKWKEEGSWPNLGGQ
jgi:hypothetical protein